MIVALRAAVAVFFEFVGMDQLITIRALQPPAIPIFLRRLYFYLWLCPGK